MGNSCDEHRGEDDLGVEILKFPSMTELLAYLCRSSAQDGII